MTTKNVTVSLEEDTLVRAQEAAKAAGISFSAYLSRAAHSQWLRDQGRKYREVMARLPADEREALDAFSAAAAAQALAAAADRSQAA